MCFPSSLGGLRAAPAAAAAVLVFATPPAVAPRGLGAKDKSATSNQPGVRISLTYRPGVRPGVAVLPVAGPAGDSVRAILERDLDYCDRVTIVGAAAAASALPSGSSTAAPDYARLAKRAEDGADSAS